jgi:acetoin utilization deacetylase AcuC-like enzyme
VEAVQQAQEPSPIITVLTAEPNAASSPHQIQTVEVLKMDWLHELMRAEGLEPQEAPSADLRSKLLAQADKMLAELEKYKTEAELDGNGSKYWWSAQSVEGQRRVVMRINSKSIARSSIYVDNTLNAVKDAVRRMRNTVERSKKEQWAAEEARLKKK